MSDARDDAGWAEGKAPASRWGALPTEARHPDSAELDTLSTERIVSLVLEEDRQGLEAVKRRSEEIAMVSDWVAEAIGEGGVVVFAGAGTSGRLGVLEAAECPPTFGTDPSAIRAIMAGGEDAVFRAVEGAEDREADGREEVAELGVGDLAIGLSASSVTPFALGALDQARRQGARTVLVTCAEAAELEGTADLVIGLATGPEILTGSTRLKAGSATKAALNAITTAAMVRIGKVYGNLMVDLRPGSAKLVDRATRIVATAAGVSREAAEEALAAADHEVKTAIVMVRLGLSAVAARERLERARGKVRAALR